MKHTKWYDYVVWITLCLLPMLPYLTDCMTQTQSPVFPYYNTIFRSPYFANENWLDLRYGPKNLTEFLVWPIYIIFAPVRANDFKNGLTDFAFAAGYVIVWVVLGSALCKKAAKKEIAEQEKRNIYFALLLLYDYWIWEKYILGYVRYGGIVLTLAACFVVCMLYEGIRSKRIWQALAAGCSLAVSVGVGMMFFCIFGGPRYYASALLPQVAAVLKEDDSTTKIRQSFTCLWKDRNAVTYDIDGVWGVVGDDSLAPALLNVDDPIVYLEWGFATGETELNRTIYEEHLRGKNIYVPLYGKSADSKTEHLKSNGFEIKETAAVLQDVPFLQGDGTVEIVRVEYTK